VKRILDSVRGALRLHPQAEWLIFALLCTIFCGELFFSVRQLSQVSSEATHLYSGYRYLKCGDLTVSPEHPPLAKLVAAAPLLFMNFAVNCSPFKGDAVEQDVISLRWLYSQNWRSALARARMAVSVFAVGLCLLVWTVARRMFDLPTAVTATVLLVFEPNLLAFGPFVLTDVPVTCMLLFAVFGFYLWARNRTTPFLLLTALATGLTLLAKHSGVAVVPILCVLAVADALIHYTCSRSTLRAVLRNLLAVAMIFAFALGIVWGGYGMRFAAYPGAVQFQEARQEAASNSARVLLAMKNYHVLPEAYLEGFAGVLSISSHSGPAFVAGKIYPRAPWFSTPFNLLIRSTTASWLMILASAFGVAISFSQRRREVLFLLLPAGIFLAVCLRSNVNVTVRYLLPMFPFVLIAVAAGCVELARRVRWVGYAVPCLVLLHAVSSLHAYPNYLSYANEFWGGPTKAYKYLSWLDAGQPYLEAKAYLEQHPAENCWFITGWQWDPRLYGIPCQTFGFYLPNQMPPRVHGTVILSSTLLTDVRLIESGFAAPFKDITPKDKIGGSSLLVYEGDFDTRLAAANGEGDQMVKAFSAGQPYVALMHGQRAVDLAPDSVLAHANLCSLMAEMRQVDSALSQCSTARSLLLQDPLREEPIRKNYMDSIEALQSTLRAQYRAVYGPDAATEPQESRDDSR